MNARLQAHRALRRLVEAVRYRAARVHEAPILVLGNQKSGTTAIAALLGRYAGLGVGLDLPREIRRPTFQLVREGRMSIDRFVRRNALEFSHPIVKAPNLTLLHDELRQRFPAARFVMIVRDPRTNIRSILNRVGIAGDLDALPPEQIAALPPGRRLLLDGRWLGFTSPHYVGQLAERWNLCADVYLGAPERFTMVRYEDFLADKQGCIGRLAAALDLPARASIAEHLETDYQPRGDRTTTPEAFFGANLASIVALCGSRMRRLGYDPEPGVEPDAARSAS